MRRLIGIVQAMGVNAVPLAGLLVAGWTPGTALAVYWCENLLASLATGGRIALHRRWTRKRGHWEASFEMETRRGKKAPAHRVGGSFLTSFLSASLVFTLAHGLFLGLILALFLPGHGEAATAAVAPQALRNGVIGVGAFVLLGFLADLPGLRRRSFAEVKRGAERTMARVVVIHLTIIFGMFGAAWLDAPEALFAVFVALKALLDLGSLLPEREAAAEAPGWLLSSIGALGGRAKAADFQAFYRQGQEEERGRRARYEEEVPAAPRR